MRKIGKKKKMDKKIVQQGKRGQSAAETRATATSAKKKVRAY
tara:strand:+ start:3347 stop:3472 length:126 start_codon:yes stop_codon:yes gene_type:complete